MTTANPAAGESDDPCDSALRFRAGSNAGAAGALARSGGSAVNGMR